MCGETSGPHCPLPERGGTHRTLGLPAAVVAAGLVLVFCAAFVVLVIQFDRVSSMTVDEMGFLAAGYTYVRWGEYRLNPEHPPLVQKLAALPLLWLQVWPPSLEPGSEDTQPHAMT